MKVGVKLSENVRFRHLCRMLDAFWPALGRKELDGFLREYFRKELKAAGRKDREWYSEALFGFFRNIVGVLSEGGRPVSRAWARSHLPDKRAEYWLRRWEEGPSEQVLFEEDQPRFERRCEVSRWSEDEAKNFLNNLSTRPPTYVRVPGEGARTLDRVSGAALQDFPPGTQVQDLASQQVGEFLEVRPGERVWDRCAGAGGKTLQIADALRGEGCVVATDPREHSLERLWDRATAEQRKVIEIARDAVSGTFDLVLVDAPCTGSGAWRRRPDQKLLADDGAIAGYAEIQRQLLAEAIRSVKPGGRWVYATCSWFVEENEDVVLSVAQRDRVEFRMLGSPAVDSDTLFAGKNVQKNLG